LAFTFTIALKIAHRCIPFVHLHHQYGQIVRGVGHARKRGGKDLIQTPISALMYPTCNLCSLHEVWEPTKEFHAQSARRLLGP
jgi:hypothetical protein